MSRYEDELLRQYGVSGEPNEEGWRGILVFVETEKAKLKNSSCEALGKARELANTLGVRLDAFFPSCYENQITQLVSYGAERVYVADVEKLRVVIEKNRYEIILFGASDKASIIAPRLAQYLKAGLIMGASNLEINLDSRELVTTKEVYNGMLLLEETFRRKPQIAVVEEGAISAPVSDASRKGEIIKL